MTPPGANPNVQARSESKGTVSNGEKTLHRISPTIRRYKYCVLNANSIDDGSRSSSIRVS